VLLVCRINTGIIASPAPNNFTDTLPAGMTLMGTVTSPSTAGALEGCCMGYVRILVVVWPDLLLEKANGGWCWLVHGSMSRCANASGCVPAVCHTDMCIWPFEAALPLLLLLLLLLLLPVVCVDVLVLQLHAAPLLLRVAARCCPAAAMQCCLGTPHGKALRLGVPVLVRMHMYVLL
jgi:hypothetical protein